MKETKSSPALPLAPVFTDALPDKRLAKRGSEFLSDIRVGCSSNIARISKDRSAQVGYYRFLDNDRIQAEDLVSCMAGYAREHAKNRHVLAIQDTTELNYRHHANWIDLETFGPVGNNTDPGFFIHPTLLMDAQRGCILGFSDVHAWKRNYEKEDKHQRKYSTLPIEEKESYKWILSAQRTKDVLDESTRITIVADREADISELFDRLPDERTDLVIRCSQDRCLIEEEVPKLYELIDALSPAGTYHFHVRGEKRLKKKRRTTREAQMEVRFAKVRIRRPKSSATDLSKYIELYMVDVREHPSTVPPGEKPVHWRLYTTHVVEDLKMARQVVEWYRMRWNIEQIFRVLKKKGLQLENSRLKSADALIKLALMSLQASIKILQASMAKGADLKIMANTVFSDRECECLWIILEGYQGNTLKQKNPFPPDSLAWAAWIIARLGGWKGYTSQGNPGPIIIKRGLEKFENMVEMAKIFNNE